MQNQKRCNPHDTRTLKNVNRVNVSFTLSLSLSLICTFSKTKKKILEISNGLQTKGRAFHKTCPQRIAKEIMDQNLTDHVFICCCSKLLAFLRPTHNKILLIFTKLRSQDRPPTTNFLSLHFPPHQSPQDRSTANYAGERRQMTCNNIHTLV